MEQTHFELPAKPSGFEDYIGAARRIVDGVVSRTQPDLIHIPGLVNKTQVASEALATLDQLLATPAHDASADLLTYTFAYNLFMKDTASNTPHYYDEMIDAVSVINQLERDYKLLGEHEQQVLQLDQLLIATADALGATFLENSLALAEAKVAKDTKARRVFRKAAVFLGLLDEEENSVGTGPEDFSEWSLKVHLYKLAVARQRIIAGLDNTPTENKSDNDAGKSSTAFHPLGTES